jgi:DNA-binding transcriptional regulator YiaG
MYLPITMTGGELKAAIRDRGLNQKEASRALGVSTACISLWVNGLRPIPAIAEIALRTVPRIPKTKKTKAA